MQNLKTLNEMAWMYVDKLPKESLTKAYLSEHSKVDNICNNNCEVFNAKVVKARAKPIITMLEEIIVYIIQRISTNKLKLSGYVEQLPPIRKE
jgi:hypothetical protein